MKKSNFLELLQSIKAVLNKKSETQLPPSRKETIIKKIEKSKLIEKIQTELLNKLNMDETRNSKIDNYYKSNMKDEKNIYNYPLKTKLTNEQTKELIKQFYLTFTPRTANKVIDILENNSEFKLILENRKNNKEKENYSYFDSNSKEIHCVMNNDLRDLYVAVHELAHTFDVKNGDNETRQIFGEIAPQYIERLLDSYLLSLNEENLKKYNINKNILREDVLNRQITTFLSRKDNLLDYKNSNNKEKNLRYILAQIYSSKHSTLNPNEQQNELMRFINSINNDNMERCSNSFGINLDKIYQTIETTIIPKELENIENLFNEVEQIEKLNQIILQSKSNKNFTINHNNQTLYVSLESKIPYLLLVPNILNNADSNTQIIMESNNLEKNDLQKQIIQGLATIKNLNNYTENNNPIFVPLLPSKSKKDPYCQQLSAECFNKKSKYRKIDLDIINSLNEAKKTLNENHNIKPKEKILLHGYSTSGVFAQRFSLIHPELIDTVCIGGASGSIPIPSKDLNYPLGIRNYHLLFNKKFDLHSYKEINFIYYLADKECDIKSNYRKDENKNPAPLHDMSYFDRSIPTTTGNFYRKQFGQNMFDRINNIIPYLKEQGLQIEHTIIPNTAHNQNEANTLNHDITEENNEKIESITTKQKEIITTTFNNNKIRQDKEH